MADDTERPCTAFRFSVEIYLDNKESKTALCKAAFSECDGIEMTMEPKTIREGGNNSQQIHLVGPVSYGQLTLKRGMTESSEALWNWFGEVMHSRNSGIRANTKVYIMDPSGTIMREFLLFGCLPIKLRGPALNATQDLVAIEEMQIAYKELAMNLNPYLFEESEPEPKPRPSPSPYRD